MAASTALNKTSKLRSLFNEAVRNYISPEKIYENLLQNYLFAGFPAALISLKMFKEFYPEFNQQKEEFDQERFNRRGKQFGRKVYGDKFNKLIKNVEKFSPEMSDWLVCEGYGKVLGRRGLSLVEREKSIILVLTVTKYHDQLYSHINGAWRLGVSVSTIKELIEALELIEEKRKIDFGLKVLNEFKKNKGMELF